MEYQPSEQLVADLKATAATLKQYGWIKGQLARVPFLNKRLGKLGDGVQDDDNGQGEGLCMTGAVGASVGTAEQIRGFLALSEAYSSPRAHEWVDTPMEQVCRALAKYSPGKSRFSADEHNTLSRILHEIINYNDSYLNGRSARKWVDRAIKGVEEELVEKKKEEGKRLRKELKVEHVLKPVDNPVEIKVK